MRRSVVPLSLLVASLAMVVDCKQVGDTGPALAALAGLAATRSALPVAEARRLGGRIEALGSQLARRVAEAAEAEAAAARAARAQPGDDVEPAVAEGDGDDFWGAATLPEEDGSELDEAPAGERERRPLTRTGCWHGHHRPRHGQLSGGAVSSKVATSPVSACSRLADKVIVPGSVPCNKTSIPRDGG